MKKVLKFAALAAFIFSPSIASAEERTVKLSVPDMSCASCPYMVRKAISAVEGTITVDATMEDHSATVTFDDAATNINKIRRATAEIGYPSTVVQIN